MHRGLDRVILECRRDFPAIEIAMREIQSQEQIELIRAGKLDAGLLTFHLPPAGLAHIELYKDRFVLCLSSRHRLSRLPSIDIALLREESFVLPAHDRAPNMHDQLIGLCATAGFYPQFSFETDSALSALHLVARGLGISFVVESLTQFKIPGVRFVPLGEHLPGRSAYFVWDNKNVSRRVCSLLSKRSGDFPLTDSASDRVPRRAIFAFLHRTPLPGDEGSNRFIDLQACSGLPLGRDCVRRFRLGRVEAENYDPVEGARLLAGAPENIALRIERET